MQSQHGKSLAATLLLLGFVVIWISRGACTPPIPRDVLPIPADNPIVQEANQLHSDAVLAAKTAARVIGTDEFPAAIKVFDAKIKQLEKIDVDSFDKTLTGKWNKSTCLGWVGATHIISENMKRAHKNGLSRDDFGKSDAELIQELITILGNAPLPKGDRN